MSHLNRHKYSKKKEKRRHVDGLHNILLAFIEQHVNFAEEYHRIRCSSRKKRNVILTNLSKNRIKNTLSRDQKRAIKLFAQFLMFRNEIT